MPSDRTEGFGFPAAKRLKNARQFDLVFRTGRRETGELARLFFLTGSDGTKAGVTVGKKIARACERTRGRRVLREAVRRLLPWVKDGVWFAASLRENALGAKADDVYFDIARSLKKRGLLKREWQKADWNVDRIRA